MAPRSWQKGQKPALLEALAGLAQAAIPVPFAGLRDHPLFLAPAPLPPPALRAAFADLPLAERLVGLHELYRDATSDRRATGVYYTPPWLAELVVGRALSQLPAQLPAQLAGGSEGGPHVVDPACGAGAFLVPALRLHLQHETDPGRRAALAEAYIGGTDTDPHAVAIARAALSLVVAEKPAAGALPGQQDLAFPGLRVVDPLHEHDTGVADLVLGNPPYLDAKSRARQSLTEGSFLRERFPDLGGAFDLFAAFVLRALELLRPGGRAGLVVPDKILSAAYATGLRRKLLAETSLLEIVDLAPRRPFPDAAVFPVYVGFVRGVPAHRHTVAFGVATPDDAVAIRAEVPQGDLAAAAFLWRPAPRTRRSLVALGTRLEVAAGTAGFDARALLEVLSDDEEIARGDGSCPFVVTGSIDRYRLRQGPVRFLKHVFRRPFVPGAALAGFAEGRRALFRAPKLVLAGMGKRLEATFVETPLALGVATYGATARVGDPLAYLSIVNSAWASHVYLERHGERRLSGGYVSFHRRELASLPIPELTDAEEASLASLARARLKLSERPAEDEEARMDAHIDEEIFGILGLPESERRAIAARFALPPRRR